MTDSRSHGLFLLEHRAQGIFLSQRTLLLVHDRQAKGWRCDDRLAPVGISRASSLRASDMIRIVIACSTAHNRLSFVLPIYSGRASYLGRVGVFLPFST